jgi:hypothetical protein
MEEHRLRIFENRVLRRIFCAKGGRSDRRKWHNRELCDLYSQQNIIWGGYEAHIGRSIGF